MKLNKLLFVLLAVALSLGFTSCSDDDDDYSANDIVGTWNLTGHTTRVTTNNGKATELVNTFLSQNDNEAEQVYIFSEDGTVVEKEDLEDWNSYSGTYQVKGNKLSISIGDEDNTCIISSLSENSLVLSASLNLNISLMDYLTGFAEFGDVSIKMLEQEFEAASVDMSTIMVKEVKGTSTYERLLTAE